MAKRVLKEDIIAPGILDEPIRDAKELNIVLNELIKTQKKLLAQSKKTAQAIDLDKNVAQGIKDIDTATKKLTTDKKNLNTLEKEEIRNRRDIANAVKAEQQALQAKNRTTIQAQKEEERQIKIATRLANEKKKLTSIYARESARLNTLRKRYKDLALSENGASTATKKLQREIQKLDKRLKQADADVGQFQRSVGDYKQALAGSLGTVGQFATGVGAIAAGVAIAGKAISSAIDIIKGFEQANANLQAVLGVTTDEMAGMIEQAKKLGASTSFTASSVTLLQTEFAKLGFPIRDIQLMTASTLDAANAMGSDLGEQAQLTGSTLKAFGLDASEATRVNDVLSKATSASALDFQKLASSMSTIAPVAASFGFSLEGTTALLGQLANAGFDASSAATATRNILLNLADANGTLAKALGKPVKDLPSLVKGLKKLEASGIDLGEALELTDKRSVAAFSTFLKGTDSVLALNQSLLEAGGTAKEMAEIQLDTLEGSVKILNSSWEGLILSMEDGNGIMTKISRVVIDDLAKGLSVISGESKEAKKEFSLLGLVLTSAKQSFAVFIGILKILAIPMTIAFNLAKKLAQRFGLVKESVGGITDALKFMVQILNNLPEITNIIVNNLVKAFTRFSDVLIAVGKGFKALITRDLKGLKDAADDLFEAINRSSKNLFQDIPAQIRAILEDDQDLFGLSEKQGKKTGEAFSKGLKGGLKDTKTFLFDLSDDIADKLNTPITIRVDPVEKSDLLLFLENARKQIDDFNAENEKNEKRKQRAREAALATAELLAKIDKKIHDAKIKAIDDEIKASQSQQDELRQAAQEGTKGAAEDLAIAERQEAEAQERRKQELKKQRRDEAALAFIKILAAKAEQGDENPFLSAVIEFGKGQAFANLLTGFHEGTDDVGESLGKPQLRGKDGHIIRVDGKEQIWSNKNRREVGYDSRDNIIKNYQLAEKLKAGDFEKAHSELTVVNQYQDNAKTLEAFKSLENVIKKNKPPTLKPMFNEYSKVFTEIIKSEGRKDRHQTKIGGGGILGSD